MLARGGVPPGENVSFAQQWPLFEALRNTASIIFAAVGAWLAIIYPERLKMSFGRGKVDPTNGNGPSMVPVDSTPLPPIWTLPPMFTALVPITRPVVLNGPIAPPLRWIAPVPNMLIEVEIRIIPEFSVVVPENPVLELPD